MSLGAKRFLKLCADFFLLRPSDFSLLEFLRRPRRFADLPSFTNLLDTIPGRQNGKKRKDKDKSSHEPDTWTGLPRYQTNHEPSSISPQMTEYAKVTTLLLSSEMQMTYYCDVAGQVPSSGRPVAMSETTDIGNGDLSPEWGVDLNMKGGVLQYGPWADKQRSDTYCALLQMTC